MYQLQVQVFHHVKSASTPTKLNLVFICDNAMFYLLCTNVQLGGLPPVISSPIRHNHCFHAIIASTLVCAAIDNGAGQFRAGS